MKTRVNSKVRRTNSQNKELQGKIGKYEDPEVIDESKLSPPLQRLRNGIKIQHWTSKLCFLALHDI